MLDCDTVVIYLIYKILIKENINIICTIIIVAVVIVMLLLLELHWILFGVFFIYLVFKVSTNI